MKPFNIGCTTCHARLLVRKPEALGTIVACPKCNAMVLIERPVTGPEASKDDRQSDAAAPTESRRPRDSAYDQVEDLFAAEEPVRIPAPVATAAAESFDDALDATGRLEEELPQDFPVSESMGNSTGSSAMDQYRPWVLAAGAGLLGIVGAIGAIRLMVGATVVQESQSQSVAASGTQPLGLSAQENSDSNAPPTTETVVRKPISNSATETNRDQTVAAEDGIASDAHLKRVANEGSLAARTAATESAVSVADETPDDVMPTPGQPKATDQFAAIVGDDLGQHADAVMEPDADNSDPMDEPIGPSSAISIISNDVVPIRLAEQLSQTIPSIEFHDMPLHQFAQFVSDYTRVPITLRWESILHAGSLVSRKVNVSVKQDTSMDQLLAQVIGPLQLTAIANGQQLEIKKRAKSDLTTTAYLVSDLLKTDYPIEDLSRLIQTVVRPGSWKNQGGVGRMKPTDDGRLAIRHVNEAHFEVVLLLEQLRVARGGKPLSTYPRELFGLADRQTLLSEVLTRPVTIHTTSSIRLAALFRELGEASGCTILPDWIAIYDLGWTPNTEVQVTSDEMAFAEMLEQVQDAFGLAIRALDARTIELTSPSTEIRRHEFALVDLTAIRENGGETNAIERSIQRAVGQKRFTSVGGAIGIDPVSNHVIVRLPQSLHALSRDFFNAWGG